MAPKNHTLTAEELYAIDDGIVDEKINIVSTEPDIYGQCHPVETPELIAQGFANLDAELAKIPIQDKAVLMRAMKECPDVVNDKHKLMFLRCEVFNADLAAKRFVRYWTKRLEYFGEKKAFKKLTLANVYDEDESEVALRRGFYSIIPVRHSSGRFIIYADPGKLDRTLYTPEMLVRAVWYITHAVLEDEEVQKKGVIAILNPRRTKFSEVEKKNYMDERYFCKRLYPDTFQWGPCLSLSIHVQSHFPVSETSYGPKIEEATQIALWIR